MEKKDLDRALERQALIFDFGDMFDVCGGRYDPRKTYDSIRPEDMTDRYLNSVAEHAAENYAPYAESWVLCGKGNHDTGILKHNNVDLLSIFSDRLGKNSSDFIGGYGGWVIFQFKVNKTKYKTIRLKYHHGGGGGGPVTRGVIQTNRQAVYLPDADIVVNGHTHDAWHVPIARIRVSTRHKQYKDNQHYLRMPGYYDEYGDGTKGFHTEKWGAPKPKGCIWMRFFYDHNRQIDFDIIVDVKSYDERDY
jgi:hypothetical protein